MHQNLLVQLDGHVRDHVTINRPKALNALNPTTLCGAAACWNEVRQDSGGALCDGDRRR